MNHILFFCNILPKKKVQFERKVLNIYIKFAENVDYETLQIRWHLLLLPS